MVIIRNRTIMWTNHEQYIGTSYDNNSETRIFQVNRILPAGTDIADFVFNITIKFSNGQNSVIMLGKETVDDVINLTWQIGRNSLLAPGPAFVQISATDSYGSIKWSTYESAVYIGNYIDYEHAGDVEMSEFERLEAYYYDLARKMVAVFESEELRETNEATRQTNEAQRARETEELIARSEEALRIAEGAVGTVSEKLGLAKSYAVGDEEAREGSSTDNAKYYKEQIQAAAEQIRTNAEDIAEEVERATTAEAEEKTRAETAETALMNTIKNAITDEYSASTTYNANKPYCIYQNKLYKLKVASSAGNLPTNTNYWDPVNVADEIKELNSNLNDLKKAGSYGAVNIISYDSSNNAYTIPRDGYISISSESDTTGHIRVVINTNNNVQGPSMYMNITDRYQIMSMFIKKGMIVYVSNKTENCTIKFIPLNL